MRPRNLLSQFPVVGDTLISYLMHELNGRLAVTPLDEGLEATIYVYTFLYAITKFISPDFRVLPERYIEGLRAKGNADYLIEIQGGGVLGVTEVRTEDYVQGESKMLSKFSLLGSLTESAIEVKYLVLGSSQMQNDGTS